MKKYALALALTLGTGLAASQANAAPVFTTLGTKTIDASTFNSDFTAINQAVLSPFKFAGSETDSGLIQSQVFKFNGATADGNPLYAYAYQVAVNPTPEGGDPAHVDSLSFKFNATGIAGDSNATYGYIISNGKVGDLNLSGSAAPTSLSLQPDATTGYIRAQYVDVNGNVPPIGPGASSATFVLLSKQPPSDVLPTVNVGGAEATVSLQKAYVPKAGKIEPAPVPEPATVLAWAGMLGAVALVRRTRKARLAAA